MKRKILNWLANKYFLERKKEIDAKYKEEFKLVKRLFAERSLREVLWEMMFPYDIKEPVNLHQRYVIFAKMNSDKDNMKLFKSKYSKNYTAYIHAIDDESRITLKGRMAELQDIIMTMEGASSKLQNWAEIEKLQSKKLNLKKDIQKEILINN